MTRAALAVRDVVRHTVNVIALAAVGTVAALAAWLFVVGAFALLSLTQ